jgi:hypothetical protein
VQTSKATQNQYASTVRPGASIMAQNYLRESPSTGQLGLSVSLKPSSPPWPVLSFIQIEASDPARSIGHGLVDIDRIVFLRMSFASNSLFNLFIDAPNSFTLINEAHLQSPRSMSSSL